MVKINPETRNVELRKYIKELEEENKELRQIVEDNTEKSMTKLKYYLKLIRK